MEIATIKDNTFLNEWLSQIHTKVHYVPDNVLTEALQYIENKGIPNLKDEAYRNVPIESILKRNFRKLIIDSSNITSNTDLSAHPNNIIISEHQTQYQLKEKGISIYTQNYPKEYLSFIGKALLHQKDFFAALNTAYCEHFTIIHITQSLQYPLFIQYHLNSTSNFIQNRILFVIDENVNATIFENISGTFQHPTFFNHLAEVYINPFAQLNWINLQNDSSNLLYNINNIAFSIEKSAQLKHNQISLNGALLRNNLNAHINNTDVTCELKGLSIGKNQNIISQNTQILHHIGYSQSNQLYKSIADDKSVVLFNGFILVDKDSQKTNAYQNSKNLLLSDNATLFAKPQLEIYADDVKCSHGSSTGALNEDAFFYLRARGIDKNSAQKLLLYAFFNDIIESIDNYEIKEILEQQIEI